MSPTLSPASKGISQSAAQKERIQSRSPAWQKKHKFESRTAEMARFDGGLESRVKGITGKKSKGLHNYSLKFLAKF
jgi:hypothetical protein